MEEPLRQANYTYILLIVSAFLSLVVMFMGFLKRV